MIDKFLVRLAELIAARMVEQIPAISVAIAKEVAKEIGKEIPDPVSIAKSVVDQIVANIPFLKKK